MNERPVTEAEIQAHVDGRLPPDRAADVAEWLRAHPEESARVAAYDAQREAVRAALAPILDEPLPPALDLRLRGHARRDGRWLTAAAAAGLVLLSGAGGWTLRGWAVPPTAGTAALAREAASSYAVYAGDAARPVELAATDRDAIDNWFSKRLSKPVRAPNLARAGLTLLGGRLVATQHGPAGLYLYQDKMGRRLAVYVRPMKVEGSDRMKARREAGIAGWTWADDGLGFGVFGAAPSADLHGAADMIRLQFRQT